jgi:tetrapyrrole methylase family protein / MazG family protein
VANDAPANENAPAPDSGARALPRITVVGLGPAGTSLLTAQARAALQSTPHRYFRTSRHPAAEELWEESIYYATYDAVYDAAEDRSSVYRRIAEGLLSAASNHGDIVYAVPGSPVMGEETTQHLLAAARRKEIELVLVPGVSFVEAAGCALGFDLMLHDVRVVDAERAAVLITEVAGPLLIGQVWRQDLLSDVKVALLDHLPSDHWVGLVCALGGPGQSVRWVPLAELDMDAQPDPLTCVFVPAPEQASPASFPALVELVRQLRGPGGCPWDAEQTHHSLTKHLIEETYEVVDAIEALPADAPSGRTSSEADMQGYVHLEEELGDLLFQVVFHATLAAEAGAFTINDVARGIHDKLIARHPHVFADEVADSAAAVLLDWEQRKSREKGSESVLGAIPGSLPALLYAHKLGLQAASAGMDWPQRSLEDIAVSRITELGAASTADERERGLGELLFVVASWARRLNIDPEAALRAAATRFSDRFSALERVARGRGLNLTSASPGIVASLWDEVAPSPNVGE